MNCPACNQECTVQSSTSEPGSSCTNWCEPVRGRAAPEEYRCWFCEGPIDKAEAERQNAPKEAPDA